MRKAVPVHPGRFLARVMRVKRLMLNDLVVYGLSPKTINDLLSLQVDRMSLSTMLALSNATQVALEKWLSVQETYLKRKAKGGPSTAITGRWES